MESETKVQHTAGPWSSQGTAGHEKHGQSVVYSDTDGKDIAIVYAGEANANLIAAAPELLGALKSLMEMRHKCFIPNPGDWWDRMAETAIAKAEGR